MTEEENIKRLYNNINRIFKLYNLLNRELRYSHGITISQSILIEILFKNKKMKMSEIARSLGVARSTATRLVDILIRNNLVKKVKKANTFIQVEISLTKEGQLLYQNLKNSNYEISTLFIKSIPEEKTENVLNSIELFLNSIANIIVDLNDIQ